MIAPRRDDSIEKKRNRDVAAALRQRAEELEQGGENPYRIRAYLKAADQIDRLPVGIETIAREGRLKEIPGIGKELAQRILQFLNLGETHPPPVKNHPFIETIVTVTGLDAALARLIYENLHIQTPHALERIIASHLLKSLPNVDLPSSREMLARLKDLTTPINTPEAL